VKTPSPDRQKQDVLVYEVPLLRNITSRADPLVVVSGKDVRINLQLDRASYLDFVLLLGTDFSQRIKNVGPTRALKFIREHGTIERVLEQEAKYRPRVPLEEYLTEVKVARSTFCTLPPIPNANLFEQHESNQGEVNEILQRYGLHRAAMVEWDYEEALNTNYFDDMIDD
jgi:flap endonuclease-1